MIIYIIYIIIKLRVKIVLVLSYLETMDVAMDMHVAVALDVAVALAVSTDLDTKTPLKKRKFTTISYAVYYKQLSALITEVSKDFDENHLTINEDNRAYVIEALREKCAIIFNKQAFPTLGEFTFSLNSDLPENIIKIILILREVFRTCTLD